jgi:hypothetical protein
MEVVDVGLRDVDPERVDAVVHHASPVGTSIALTGRD